MRALIVVCSALVVALAVSIVLYVEERPKHLRQTGLKFEIKRLIQDASVGEFAIYRESATGQRMRYVVVERPAPSPGAPPYVVIRRDILGRDGRPLTEVGASLSYDHQLVQHGWYPFLTPEVPNDYDRVWAWREIRREALRRRGRESDAWRVDFIDPSLPESSDAVVAWFDVEVPVFGLLQWRRNNETWIFERGGRS